MAGDVLSKTNMEVSIILEMRSSPVCSAIHIFREFLKKRIDF